MGILRLAAFAASATLMLGAAAPGPGTSVRADPAPTTPSHGAVLTHEALWGFNRVGAPTLSPDGRLVLFQVTEPAYDPDQQVSDLWIVPVDGSAPPRRITHTKGPESGAVFSPDGGRIAFSAKREGDAAEQIYVLDLAGGEAERVTSVSTGAENPKWRPDGRAILFESQVWPGALTDAANAAAAKAHADAKAHVRVYDHFPVRYWNRWLDERRPTILVQELTPGAPAKDVLSATALVRSDRFAGRNGDERASLSPQFSPDGSEILFTAAVNAHDAASARVVHRLYRMPAAGGEPRPALSLEGDVEEAKFSPDGRGLFVKFESPSPSEVYGLHRLMRASWPEGGAAAEVAPGFDQEVAAYVVAPDSRALYLLVPHAGHEGLWKVAAAGGRPVRVEEPETGGYTALAAPRSGPTRLAASYGSSVSPLEIYAVDPDGRGRRPLTRFAADEAARIDWRPPLSFWFKAKDGRDIHSFVVLPPRFDAKARYPLLVLMHGGPASANVDQIGLRWNPHLLAAGGYVVLMTDYKGSTSYGEAFAQAIKGDPLRGPAEEINEAADEAARLYPFIDAGRACAAGASYGGHLAYWMEASTTRYRCIVAHAGEVDQTTQWGESDVIYGREVENGGPPWGDSPVWRDQSPLHYAADFRTPILLSVGERDFRVPIGNTLEAFAALQRMKVESRLLVWPDAWHWITRPEDSRRFYSEVGRFLDAHLKPQAASATP